MGVPGTFRLHGRYSDRDVYKLRMSAYHSWSPSRACRKLEELLWMDGLVKDMYLDVGEFSKPTRHWIGMSTRVVGRSDV